MGTIVICLILLVIVIFAVKKSMKHFQGGGDCCGGGSVVTSTNKVLSQVLDQRVVIIDGMHCENCARRIENAINEVSYLACHVSLDENKAIVESTQMIQDEEIVSIIKKVGYHVVEIKKSGE